MAERPIVLYPEPILRVRATEIEDPSAAEIRELIEDMRATLDAHIGVGIAAPQIGTSLRAIAIDATRAKRPVANHGALILLNPVILQREGHIEFREGCLSVPDLVARVPREERVNVRAINAETLQQTNIDAVGFEAVILQHEIDHLDGILFIDRVRTARDIKRRGES